MPTAGDVPRAQRARMPILLHLAFLIGWSVSSALVVRAATNPDVGGNAQRAAAGFVVLSGLLTLYVIRRDVVGRRRINALLTDRQALIESVGIVTDPRLSQLSLHRLLDELLQRARTVLGADTASLFLYEEDRDQLRRTASSGLGATANEIVVVPMGSGVIGEVAQDRRVVALLDAPKQAAIPRGTTSLLATPLVVEGQLVGVLQVGTSSRREFTDNDLNLFALVADRTAIAIETARLEREAKKQSWAADAGRRRLALLAEAGDILARSFDSVAAMSDALGGSIVPAFADYFAFYDLDEHKHARLLSATAGPELAPRATEHGWPEPLAAALDHGQPQLVWGADLVRGWPEATRRRISSLTVVPVSIRTTRVGVLVLGTAGRRRGFRPSDLALTVDLGARFAVALERIQLAAETARSAANAARHADQLQRLTEAAFAVNAALSVEKLAHVVAEQAARVLEAEGAAVDVIDASGARLRLGTHGTVGNEAVLATTDLTAADGTTIGGIILARNDKLGREERSVLRSLGQTASVALTNARLYETVRTNESHTRALYDASPVGIVEVDRAGRASRWNRAAEELFGWAPFDSYRGEPPVVPDDARRFVARAIDADEPASIDLAIGALDAELVVVPLHDADWVARRAVLTAVDLTERKHVAEQLQQAHRMEAMARLAGGIAHDFNNVLMVITGYADLLLRRGVDDDARVDVEAIREAAKRAAEFTRRLLSISRQQLVQAEIVDVEAMIASLADVLPMMVGRDIAIDLRVVEPPPVLIDPGQLEQLVLNLVLNAKDAMPAGGTLSIAAGRVDGDGEWTLLEVADTGEGMTPEVLEHCFEPFFSTKSRTRGTGLGLSTVYSAVTQAGGDIEVESTVGAGTRFTIRLPAADGVPAPAAPTGGSLRILVVDDDPDVRAVVADMLELEGHEVLVAPDGPEALRVARAFAPELVLSDIVMPEMRGTELARRLLEEHPDMRVVLMSSHVDDELAGDALGDGLQFLAKPFTRDGLVAMLDGRGAAAHGSKR